MPSLNDLFTAAQAQIGKPYVWGDEGPNRFDCSGLMQYVFAQIGVSLPRTADEQQRYTSPTGNPQPGDLVFYGQPAYHVGLYLGGGKMESAPGPGQTVHVVGVGNPTGYGRVPGLGGTLSLIGDTLTGAGGTVTDWLTGTFGAGVQHIVFEVLFLTLGAGLLAYGVYRTASPATRRALNPLES